MVGFGVDPVEAGLVDALPVRAATSPALQTLAPELGGKRLELLKEAVTKVARVAVLYDPATADSAHDVKEVLPVAARALGLFFGLGSYELRMISTRYSLRSVSGTRMGSMCPAGAR